MARPRTARLAALVLSDNSIGPGGARALAALLCSDGCPLERLELSRILVQPPCHNGVAAGLLEGGDAQLALIGIGELHQR